MTGLTLEKLSKRFGGLRVTREVSLFVAPGSIHALIGPNGAGKTSLINQVSGTLAPDAGRVLLDHHDVTALPMRARVAAGLARTFQITTLVPGFTALENVALAVQRHAARAWPLRPAAGDRRLEEPAREALATVGLDARAGLPAGALSHGEKRALEIAVALATRPRVLLLDEPLAGAGAEETERLIRLLDRLRRDLAILLVEHDTRAVFALADLVTVLVEGAVVAQGEPGAVRRDPAVIAAYLGEDALA